jgi:anthranilate phosphoribosyltransferase
VTGLLAKLTSGDDLSREEARGLFDRIMSGQVPEPVLAALLAAMATKGETVDEIVGAAEAMRAVVTPVRCAGECIDTCGTGGDGISTFNVSTTAAIIAAAAGATVAKHGNRTNTRVSGSAEVLDTLGVNINASVAVLERCLAETRIAFLFAPDLHPAMKHAMPVRKALKVRTIFNLLGPLTNPAGARRQVLGVSRPDHVELVAQVLARLGAERAMVVHGHNGLCDLTITGPTQIAEVVDGNTTARTIEPEELSLTRAPLNALLVPSASASAEAVRDILAGIPGPRRDHAVLNASAALVVAGVANDLTDGVTRAAEAIDSGRAKATLDRLVEVSAS